LLRPDLGGGVPPLGAHELGETSRQALDGGELRRR
jgi:hypothetical protein